MIKDYYEGRYVCSESSCAKETRTLHNPNQCVLGGCKSKLKAAKISEKGVADTFNYLERLFDSEIKQKCTEDQKKQIHAAIDPHQEVYRNMKKKVTNARANNGYDKVELDKVFAFMHNMPTI
jgi:hypothetical protein